MQCRAPFLWPRLLDLTGTLKPGARRVLVARTGDVLVTDQYRRVLEFGTQGGSGRAIAVAGSFHQ